MNRLPSQQERNDLPWYLTDAESRRNTALNFMLLIERADGAHSTPRFSMTFASVEDPRCSEDFKVITPYGDVVARFDLAQLNMNGDINLYGRYKFYFSKPDENDKPIAKLICSLCLHSNQVRLGTPEGLYSGTREINERFLLMFFPWLLVNVFDVIDEAAIAP